MTMSTVRTFERQGVTATLYLGDCLEIMPTLGKVDAVVTDPPYGISDAPMLGQDRTGKRTGTVNTWHKESTWDRFFDPEWCISTSKSSDVVFWFGHWRKRELVEANISHKLRAEFVWDKGCHVGPPCPLAMRDERCWLFSKEAFTGKTFETTILDVPMIPTWEHKRHKNEKPVALMQRICAFSCDVGSSILDPFMGSGTTGVACIRTGRNFIGIDIDPDYYEIACERIDRECRQGVLI